MQASACKVFVKGIPLRPLKWIKDELSFQHLKEELSHDVSWPWLSASLTSFFVCTAVEQLPYYSLDLAIYLKWLKRTFSFSSKYSRDERIRLNAINISNKYYLLHNCDIMIIFMWEKVERDKPPPSKPDFLLYLVVCEKSKSTFLKFWSWRPEPRHDAVCPVEGALDYQMGTCCSSSTEWATPSDSGISVFWSLPRAETSLRTNGCCYQRWHVFPWKM